MKAIPGWLLKVSAGVLTGLAAAGSTAYVTGHVKSPSAPLHPAVASAQAGRFGHLGLGPTSSAGSASRSVGGHLVLKPSVESSSLQPITITSVS